MQHAEDRATALEAELVALHVSAQNLAAIAFYERSGYRRHRLVTNYYAPASHAWLYRKSLIQT